MPQKHHVHMHIPTHLNDWLEKERERRGISKTAITIQALEEAKRRAEADGEDQKGA